MHIAMNNALAILSWHEFKFLGGDFTDSGSVWLLIGFLLAIVVLSALAAQAGLVLHAPRRSQSRASWPADISESAVPVPPGQANLDGSGTPT
ncbi:MAG: hypothetical protein ABR957_10665 [Terracidiphilus sp.]|jgi:hypothetical protein